MNHPVNQTDIPKLIERHVRAAISRTLSAAYNPAMAHLPEYRRDEKEAAIAEAVAALSSLQGGGSEDDVGELVDWLQTEIDGACMPPERRTMLRRIAEALSANRARAAIKAMGQGWRPIEEAPKDGSDVLLFFPLEGLDHNNHPQVIIGFWRANVTHPGLSGWTFQGRAYRAYSEGYNPTHFMTLPAPPLEEGR